MLLNARNSGDALCIDLTGELDESTAKGVASKIDDYVMRARPKSVTLNLMRLSFMDSTGIGVILGRYRKLNAAGIRLFIANPTKLVDKILLTTGIYDIIPKTEWR